MVFKKSRPAPKMQPGKRSKMTKEALQLTLRTKISRSAPPIQQEQRKLTFVGSNNGVVGMDAMKSLVESSLCCGTCKEEESLIFSWSVCHYTTSVSIVCKNGCAEYVILPPVRQGFDHSSVTTVQPVPGRTGLSFTRLHQKAPVHAFEQNTKAIVGMQALGRAQAGFDLFRAALGIQSPNFATFSRSEQIVSGRHVELGKSIVRENLVEEIEETRKIVEIDEETGLVPLTGKIDTGWTKREGKNSPTAQSAIVGGVTNKCIALELMNKNTNYTGSSKGMEATGAERSVLKIFNDPTIGE